MRIKPEWILRLVGLALLTVIDRWREGSAGRAERRHLRHLREAERRDDTRPGFQRKGDA